MFNYMTNEEYKEEEIVKFLIITNKNIPLIATKKSDGKNMKKTFNLDYYNDNEVCTYHIDYLQVLLNKYFKNTPLEKYIGITDNDKTEEIIAELVENNNIVFSNTTLYESMNYKINNKQNGRLYLNNNTKKDQLIILRDNQPILNNFDNIELYIYKHKKIAETNYIHNSKKRKLTK